MKKFLILFCLLHIKLYTQSKQDWITIFIHGSVGLRANINLCTFRRLIRDCVTGSAYEKNVAEIRSNPFLFTMQPIQEYGLKPIIKQKSTPSAAYAFATLYNYMQKKYRNKQCRNKFYTFGWSGLISNKKRCQEARILYIELRKELERLRKRNFNPKIRIVAYSHGASLTFNLATLRDQEFINDTFLIDEMISIGTPIFTTTKDLMNHPIFKSVYHFYSERDIIQKIDIFSGGSPSSRYYYPPLPQKLKQIEIKITELFTNTKNCNFPFFQKNFIDQSPNHTELWFFGWAKRGYNPNFILYPLPTAIFIPYLQYLSDKVHFRTNNITIDLRPKNQRILISKKCQLNSICLPFMNQKEYSFLVDKALSFHPCQDKYLQNYMILKRNFNCDLYK